MKGPLAYIGGKVRLAEKIISMLPAHTTYVEPFAGGAQVFFHKEPSEVEILNDLDGEIVNFFRICQSHYQELLRYIDFMVVSRDWYTLWAQTPANTLTDVQRAARFLYLQKNSFAGRVTKQNYALHVVNTPNYNPQRLPELIEQTHKRLQNVQIESLPYEKVIEKCDRASTFFYLDPPYFDRQLYKFNLKEDDFKDMARRLANVKGKFLLSLNDLPEVRQIFSGFRTEQVTLAYSAQKQLGRRYKELLIRNY